MLTTVHTKDRRRVDVEHRASFKDPTLLSQVVVEEDWQPGPDGPVCVGLKIRVNRFADGFDEKVRVSF